MTAAAKADPGSGIDFMLGVSQATLRGLGRARDAVSMIAQNVKEVYKGQEKANEAIITQEELITANQKATEKLVNTFSNVKRLVIWATGIYTVKEALEGLFAAGERIDNLLAKHTIAFNGYMNALGAYAKFQNDIMSGKLLGQTEQYMEASQILMRKGIHATDAMIGRLNDWAAAAGTTVDAVASAIDSAISGNTAAFEQFGITERSLRHLQMYTANTNQMKDAVLRFVSAQKQFNGMAQKMPTTWADIANRLKAMKDKFLEAIIGRAGDPNSLNALVKRTVSQILDFLYKNAATFKAIAATISATLKWIFVQIGHFVQWVIGKTQQGIDNLQKFVNNYKERLAGFILFLELMKMRVLDFLRAHGDTIKTIIKWYAIYRVAKWALLIPTKIILSLIAYGERLQGVFNVLKWMASGVYQFLAGFGSEIIRQGPIIARYLRMARVGMLGFNAVAIANPIGLIVVAAAALVGWIVYLVTHWKEVQERTQNVNGALLVMASVLMPIVGIPLLMAKYWKQVKAIIVNTIQIVKNLFSILINGTVLAFKKIKGFFISLFRNLWAYLPDWIKDFGGYIYRSLVLVTGKIKAFFSDLIPDWLKNAFTWVGESVDEFFALVADGTKNLADKTAKIAEKLGGTGHYGVPIDAGSPAPAQPSKPAGTPIVNNRPVMLDYPKALGKAGAPSVTNIDQSVHFGEGAIPINAQGMTPDEIYKGVQEAISRERRSQNLKGRQ